MPSVYAITVANRFIELGIGSANLVDPMKLQKLVYIAHGWSLARTGGGMIREAVEAWPYGPVVPTLYTTFKTYRSSTIDTPIALRQTENLETRNQIIVQGVWNHYQSWTAILLSMLTHEDGSAWDLTRKMAGPGGRYDSPVIYESLIRDEFQRRLRDDEVANKVLRDALENPY